MSKKKKKNKKVKKPKKNLNKVLKNNDFTDILFEEPVVSARLDKLYIMLRKTQKGAAIFNEIEEKLNECTESKEVDSYGFYIYCMNLVRTNTDVAVYNFEKFFDRSQPAGNFPPNVHIILLFREYHKKAMYKKKFAKYSLLYSFVGCMGERFIRALVDGLRDRKDEYLDEGLENLNWSQLKDRFMKAIFYREKSAAFKLLGRLSNLDPGESHYFEALAHYNNNEYDDAIRFARKVSPDNIDYNNAVSMILKSYALKGEFDNFMNYLFKESKIKINIYYYLYLMQILMVNSKDIKRVLTELEGKLEYYKPDEPIGDTSEHIISKQELIRNSCKLALERMELLEEIDLYLGEYGEKDEIPDELGYRLIQITTALNVLPELGEHLTKEGMTKAELCNHILTLLMENYKPEFEDYYLGFISQLRLDMKEQFINHVAFNGERLLVYRDERAWELIEAAYVESRILGYSENQSKLYELLKSAGRLDSRRLDQYEISTQMEDNLSKEGKIAYESAVWQYEKAISEDYGWKDAGMISLAYFRIIEVEINQKLIIPAINLIGATNIKNLYQDILTQYGGKEREDIEKKWSSLIHNFESIEKGRLQGLTLEAVEWLFGMIKSKSLKKNKPDYNLRKLVYDNIARLVTDPEGIAAIDEGKICSLVKCEYRNKYRNPPAHTRYLHIDVAKECKQFVEDGLLQFFSWV